MYIIHSWLIGYIWVKLYFICIFYPHLTLHFNFFYSKLPHESWPKSSFLQALQSLSVRYQWTGHKRPWKPRLPAAGILVGPWHGLGPEVPPGMQSGGRNLSIFIALYLVMTQFELSETGGTGPHFGGEGNESPHMMEEAEGGRGWPT